MTATVLDCRYIPSRTSFKQGYKGGRVPPGAVAGGNGSFYVSTPPQVILLMEGPRGARFQIDVSDDVAMYVHGYLGKRMTEKQARRAVNPMIGKKVELTEDRKGIEKIGYYFPD